MATVDGTFCTQPAVSEGSLAQPASSHAAARSESGSHVEWVLSRLGSSLSDSSLSDEERVEATESLVEAFHQDVYRYSYWLSGCSSAAEDITQETFLRAYRGLHALRSAAAAKSWLLTIARHEFSRWSRKSIAATVESPVDKADETQPTQQLETQEWLQRAMAELPTEFRMVILMHYFEQLSYAQIAEQLEVPIGTVMSRLSRGRNHLRVALEHLELPNRER